MQLHSALMFLATSAKAVANPRQLLVLFNKTRIIIIFICIEGQFGGTGDPVSPCLPGGGGLYRLEFLQFKFCTKICTQFVRCLRICAGIREALP